MRRAWLVTLLFLLHTAAPAQDIRVPYRALSDSITRIMGFAPTGGNSVQSFRTGQAYLAALLEDIGAAKERIDLEYYWFTNDDVGRPVQEALIRKAREGVQVRVMVDNLVVPFMQERFYRELEKAGASLCYHTDFKKVRLWQLPEVLLGERDHRKIVVLDGHTCYTGGMNFCDYILEWEDTQMRITGPLAVSMGQLFDQIWQKVSGDPPSPVPSVAASGEGAVIAQLVNGDGTPALEETYIRLLESVRHYIWFQTPYLVPSPALLQALGDAAGRGVDVRLLLPLESDWPFMNEVSRYYFDPLLEAGVRLYTCADAYDHSKGFVADNYLSCCGTVNLDNRSFFINGEDTVFFYDEKLALECRRYYEGIIRRSEPVVKGEGQAKGFRQAWRDFWLSVGSIL